MEDREERLKRFEREDFIITNQVVNTPEETARCIKIVEEVMSRRKAQQLITREKSNGLLLTKKRTGPKIRRSR